MSYINGADTLGLTGPRGAERVAGDLARRNERAASHSDWVAIALHLSGDMAALEGAWKALECHADCTPFQTFGRLGKWQANIGSRKGTLPVIVTGGDPLGGLLFLMPLAIERHGLVRRLTWLGSELSDYNAPMLAQGFQERFGGEKFPPLWRRISKLLQADPRYRFDLVDLSKMPAQVGGQDNPFLTLPVSPNPSGAYLAHLGTNWEAFYATKRSAGTRKRERRQLKQLAGLGEISFEHIQSDEAIAPTLEALFDQKARSLARRGVPNIFARPGFRQFYLDLASDPATRTGVHLSRLTVGSTVAAVGFGLVFRSCFYLVLSSYDDGPMARYGPGRAHLHELLRHVIERHFTVFDFTIGDEPYKRDWSDTELQLSDHVTAASLRGSVVTASLRAARRAKRAIKQNPALWRAFSKIRAIKNAMR